MSLPIVASKLLISNSQFCVAVAGFKIVDPLSDLVFGTAFDTPTLHIIGRNDIIVTPERSQTLLEVSANKRVEEHDGGEPASLSAESSTALFQVTLSRPRQAGANS